MQVERNPISSRPHVFPVTASQQAAGNIYRSGMVSRSVREEHGKWRKTDALNPPFLNMALNC